MNENINTAVFRNLYDFYASSKEWLGDYSDFATNFDTELVERRESFRDLDGILEDYTVLVLTANSVEQNILTKKLYEEVNAGANYPKKLCEIYSDDGCVYQFAPTKNVNIVHIHPNSTASFTDGGSADAIRSALERFRPKLVVSLGVAFGIDPTRQNLGDVLLSSGIIPYDAFNKDTLYKDKDNSVNVITLRPQDKRPTHTALNAWNVLMRNRSFSLEKESKRRSLINKKLSFEWEFGTMLSGGSVLSNEAKKQTLLEAAAKCGEEHIIGGEMEGSGVYFECNKPNIPCIVIKGICDWAAEKNSWETVVEIVNQNRKGEDISSSEQRLKKNDSVKDCVQAYAMDHAIEALLRLLRFDSHFLDAYSKELKYSTPRPYKFKQMFERMKLFLISQWGALLKVFVLYSLLILGFVIFNYFLDKQQYFEKNVSLWIVYASEFLVLIEITVVLAIKRSREVYPLEITHAWVNFRFVHDKGILIIENNDLRPIFHVVSSQWIAPSKILQRSESRGNLNAHDLVNVFKLEELGIKTIIQIEYELSNGDRYIHLISGERLHKDHLSMYCQRVFFVDGTECSLVGIQKTAVDTKENHKNSVV